MKYLDEDAFDYLVSLINNLTILSLVLAQYPFLFHLLSFQEVQSLFKKKITMILFVDIQKAMLYLSYELCGKINNKENIYDEKNKLKKLQILLINYILISVLVFKI